MLSCRCTTWQVSCSRATSEKISLIMDVEIYYLIYAAPSLSMLSHPYICSPIPIYAAPSLSMQPHPYICSPIRPNCLSYRIIPLFHTLYAAHTFPPRRTAAAYPSAPVHPPCMYVCGTFPPRRTTAAYPSAPVHRGDAGQEAAAALDHSTGERDHCVDQVTVSGTVV